MWWLWTHRGEEKDVAKFRAKLWQPPKGQAVTDKRSPWSPEQETSAFGALKSALGLGAPKPADTATPPAT